MSGFSNSVLGGVGNLIRSWIQSVPFVSGSTGWRISKNGNAEFNNITVRGNVIITTVDGVFVYSGTPAAGNLVESLAGAAGTDAVGNAYPAGYAAYNPTDGLIVNISTTGLNLPGVSGQLLNIRKLLTGHYTENVNTVKQYDFMDSGSTLHTFAELLAGGFQIDVGILVSRNPVGPYTNVAPAVAETWHNLVLNAGFAASGSVVGTPGYQYEAVNGGRVRLRGEVKLTAAQAANTAIAQLPPSYTPALQQEIYGANSLSGSVASRGCVYVDNGGMIRLAVAGALNNVLQINGTIELD